MTLRLSYIDAINNPKYGGLSIWPKQLDDKSWLVRCSCGSSMKLTKLPKKEALANFNCKITDCASCKTYTNKDIGFYYICTNKKCSGIHTSHPNGKPLGRPGSAACRQLRHYLHLELDDLHINRGLNRGQSYGLLSRVLYIDRKDCHIALFSIIKCKKAIYLIRKWKSKRDHPLILPELLKE